MKRTLALVAATVAVVSGLGTGIAGATPATSFSDGQYRVGIDIYPGIYHTNGGQTCYWERQSGLTGKFDDIIANEFGSGPQTVQILPSDVAFKSNRCGTWIMQPPPPPAPSIFGS